MSLSIIKPGLQDTFQDKGRYGYGSRGINEGGAMDQYAAATANMLVGNESCEAVLEIHFPGPHILFEQNTLISITGADFTPTLNDHPLPLWQPIIIRKNTVLHFPALAHGARCYLAVHGGFEIDKWLDSYSTHLKAGAGGFHGKSLQKGDILHCRESTIYFAGLMKEGKDFMPLNWRAVAGKVYQYPHEIFFVPGNEWNKLTDASREAFTQSNFIIHPSSDRMGYQIKGEELQLKEPVELVSTGVSFGTVQLLPNNQLVILMADHQTTGGYPRLAHIISAHLPKLAQLRPSDSFRFTEVGISKAEELLFSQMQDMAIVKRACFDHLNELVCRQLT